MEVVRFMKDPVLQAGRRRGQGTEQWQGGWVSVDRAAVGSRVAPTTASEAADGVGTQGRPGPGGALLHLPLQIGLQAVTQGRAATGTGNRRCHE